MSEYLDELVAIRLSPEWMREHMEELIKAQYNGKVPTTPKGYRVVDFRTIRMGDIVLSADSSVFTASGNSSYVRLILEVVPPVTIEVEVVSFEPVIEEGKVAHRRPTSGEYITYGGDFCKVSSSTYYPYDVYRRVVTKKVVEIPQ